MECYYSRTSHCSLPLTTRRRRDQLRDEVLTWLSSSAAQCGNPWEGGREGGRDREREREREREHRVKICPAAQQSLSLPGYRSFRDSMMEVPRVGHSVSSPTSPCEDMIKNLSLDAIQLCGREGKKCCSD